MILILAEKYQAAKKIAEAIGSNVTRKKAGRNLYYFEVDWNGKRAYVVPLRGHIIDIDFPPKYRRWELSTLRDMIREKPVEKVTDREIFSFLNKIKNAVEEVIIATDADREGEAIGFEVYRRLFRNKPVKRAWFSSLTKEELVKAFNNLIRPKENLAGAAFARREVDLKWGAVLTRALSIKENRRGKEFLSVGRVQTPTLALIVEREREIRNFKPKTYYKLVFHLKHDNIEFSCEYDKQFDKKEEAEDIAKHLSGRKVVVTSIERKEVIIYRPVPFDTTTLLSESSKLLGFSPGKTMKLAEGLYLMGYITYPRTDNQTYPPGTPFKKILGMLGRVSTYSTYVKNIKPPYRPSSGRKTDDHPPVYPVGIGDMDKEHFMLYDLIVRRFLATLYRNAVVEETNAFFELDSVKFSCKGRKVVDPGWTEVYPVSIEERILPDMEEGDVIEVERIDVVKRKTKPPSRYSPSELLKKMEQLGLGTKSTRAEIIEKLYKRGYITGRKRIKPTELGELVYDIFLKSDPVVIRPDLTAMLEENMREIEEGKRRVDEVVRRSSEVLESVLNRFLEHYNKGEKGESNV